MNLTPSVREDSRLAIAQLRLDVERELFLLSRHTLSRSKVEGRSIGRSLEELEKAGTIRPDFARNLRSFVELANTIVHQSGIATEQVERCTSVGGALVANLRHKRLLVEVERDFEGHALWHMHRHLEESQKKYYFWSAVAGSLPVFDYNYDVYHEAAEIYNRKLHQRGYGLDSVYILSLEEFVAVLKFCESELLRIIQLWDPGQGWGQSNRTIEWQWPSEWGDVGWTGPILREKVHLWGAEEELMRTRAALAECRRRLLAKRCGDSA